MFVWHSECVEDTERVAQRLAESLEPGAFAIALDGPLGAGKTAFVRGLARGLGLDVSQVASPTFVIANEYRLAESGGAAARALVHVDFYRVEREEELIGAGFEEFLRGPAILAVEWAKRFPLALPEDRLEIQLARPGGAQGVDFREIVAEAGGEGAAMVLAEWSKRLGGSSQRR